MRNPRDMRTIQIEITNACVRSCANCTRFCGHHKRPFYMSVETFKKAVDSLEGYDGIVGMMGGEPTLHPNFSEMALYLGKRFGKINKLNADRRYLRDFPAYVACKQAASMVINKDGGAGLWTSLTKQYYKYYELVQNTFSFQNLNDHSKPSYHQPVLITRKEYGVSDDEWIHLRDNCWIQNYWSASITPKGVFFCEVAAALDILLGGPGGFTIQKGWWKRDISEFKSQFHWCELCGAALKTFDNYKRDANEGIDDISPVLYEKLTEIGSKKIEGGNYKLFKATKDDVVNDDSKYGSARYVEDYSDRFGDSMGDIRPRSLSVIEIADIAENFGQSVFNKIETDKKSDWILLIDKDYGKEMINESELKELYLNPGCCYVNGYSQMLFNVNAEAYRRAGYDGFYGCESLSKIKGLWDERDIVYLEDGFQTYDNYKSDITRWEIIAQNDILNDYAFRNALVERLTEKGMKKGSKILMLLPANYMFGRAVYEIFENMDYSPHIFIYEGHKARYKDFVPEKRLYTFKNNQTYDFDKLKAECDTLKGQGIKFDGSLMLVNLPYVHLCTKDGYDDVVKIAEYMAMQFIGCINIRRRFSCFTKYNS